MKPLIALAFILFVSDLAFSQSCELTGTVITRQNAPVPGVNILLKGTSTVTVSNINGRFELHIPAGDNIILYQLIGFKPLEQKIFTSVDSIYESTVILIDDKRSNKKFTSSARLCARWRVRID